MTSDTEVNWRVFGHIDGIAPGRTFTDRDHCYKSGVHRRHRHGIAGTTEDGAYSICLAGGYEDNIDEGNIIKYCGEGRGKSGRPESSGRNGFDETQRGDQDWVRGNAALQTSHRTGKPIRVVRGAGHSNSDSKGTKTKYTPIRGYRYDGLYRVTEAKKERGKSGFMMCKFTLVREPGQSPIPENTFWDNTRHLGRAKKAKKPNQFTPVVTNRPKSQVLSPPVPGPSSALKRKGSRGSESSMHCINKRLRSDTTDKSTTRAPSSRSQTPPPATRTSLPDVAVAPTPGSAVLQTTVTGLLPTTPRQKRPCERGSSFTKELPSTKRTRPLQLEESVGGVADKFQGLTFKRYTPQ